MSAVAHSGLSRRFSDAMPPLIVLALLLGGWEAAVRILHVPSWLLPAPSRVAARFFNTRALWYHTGVTLGEAMAGFALSAVCGVALSAALVHSRFLERGLLPYVIVSNAIPIIAIIPLLTIWVGFGMTSKVLIAAIITFFPIVTNTTRGLKSADPRVLEFMRSINARRRHVLCKVQLPAALPFMFAGFKIAASLSLVGAVVAEFYGADRGLGQLVITSANEMRTDLLFVCITVLAVLGIGLFSVFSWLERLVVRGEPEAAGR